MVVLVVKRRLAAVFGVCLVLGGVLASAKWLSAVPVFSAAVTPPVVLVIDPGHGGEDGGAVSADQSVTESQINLEIALRVRDLMTLFGQPTVMTRTEDRAIYSSQAQTLREKKVSDLKNRVALVNELDGAVLLSIHQNSLPSSPVTHGAQVFWNGGEGAEAWGTMVQDALNQTVNAGNEKQGRRIADSIYLMKHVQSPAVLVECGFLSNGEETVLLQKPDYQLTLAAAIAAGYMAWNGE
ncbi:MAG: N-acetylmuramoyl-L-alanine amidase [Dysosmobacter sp.]|uniref:N-acetylmuramoyl-L-alanine amidase n=1 Tax=Dysosmobacter sp. TaxID=2591382 RepID=UPI003D9071E7